LDYGDQILEFDAHTTLDHLVFKQVWPTSARDFVNLTHWRVEEDGTVIIAAKVIEHPRAPVPKKGELCFVVRCFLAPSLVPLVFLRIDSYQKGGLLY
jgi:hypothetical protein